jgi:hypothetical protein
LEKATKRKPDLVCLLAKKFKSLFDKGDHHGFKACMSNARKPKGDDKKLDFKEVAKITWGDILQSWELEFKGKISSEIPTDFRADDFLGTDDEEIIIDGTAVASTSQGKCTFVSWTQLMLFQFKFLPPVASSVKEVQQVFPHRRKSKPTSHFPRSSQELRRTSNARFME